MSEDRDFKGIWIPRDVWLDPRLDALEKVLLAEIDSLSSYEKKCIKSNAAFAEFCQCSESKVSKAIKKLIDLGYVEQIAFDGRHRTLQSCLVKYARQTQTKAQADPDKNTASNTMSNPGSKPMSKRASAQRFAPPTVDAVAAYCAERKNGIDATTFVDYYASRGWMIGKNKMKDWKAAVRTWENRRKAENKEVKKDYGTDENNPYLI